MTDETPGQNTLYTQGMWDKAKQGAGAVRNNIGNEFFILFIAAILWAFDVWITHFEGINLVRLWKAGPQYIGTLFYTEIIASAAFWIIVALFFFLRSGKSWEQRVSQVLLIATVFFILLLLGVNNFGSLAGQIGNFKGAGSGILHLIFIIFGIGNGIIRKRHPNGPDADYYIIFLIFLDFFSFNLIHSFFPASSIHLNRVIFPLLPIILLTFFMDESKTRTVLLFAITVFYILIFMREYNLNVAAFKENIDPADYEAAQQQLAKGKSNLWGLFNVFKQNYEESQRIISGDYYTGQVEEYEYEPLGVFLEDIESADEFFLEGETINVWANLKAYTIEKNIINVNLICYALNNTKPIDGIITPRKEFTVESFDEEFITCTFDNFGSGYYSVVFNATFDFTTQGYLRSYYIEKERKRVLTSERIDIFEEYGISDRNPIARFTNGPVKIGMETTSSLPIGVPADNNKKEFSSFLGITLDNNWDGNIVSVNSLKISLPDGLKFVKTCDIFKQTGDSYFLVQKEIDKYKDKKISLPKSYKCSLDLDNSRSLLGNTPISIKNFEIETDYTYRINEKTSVTVKKKNDEQNN